MANCGSSLIGYVRQCGEKLIGGTKNIYMIAYSDLKNIEGSTSVYSMTAGKVSEVGLQTSKKFVPVQVENKNNSITDTLTVGDNSIISGNFAFTAQMVGYSAEANQFVSSLLGQPVAIIIELANSELVIAGLDGTIQLKESVGTISASDLNRTLSFAGEIYSPIALLDKTILQTLV
ncbi:hypothetical protein [Sphingobacterium multivorum]|uniref:hypothetical protein n=1 Tax=Sphingobacterium multivorum TaxID=28454 RepID=UPI0028AB5480|nr:hypothetical protein [Sphingobacterium multivorum]